MLSGGSGQLYGSATSWRLEKGWQARLDTPGALQLKVMKSLFARRRWYQLVPDQDHTTVRLVMTRLPASWREWQYGWLMPLILSDLCVTRCPLASLLRTAALLRREQTTDHW
jgi:hypothetical protein